MRIGFIGGGTMAEAILSGVLDRELASPDDIAVSEVVEARREYLSERYGVTVTDDGAAAAAHGSLVLLAVKPQDLPKAMSGMRKSLSNDQAALSIVAGATIRSISKGLDHDSVVRIMPNTPAQIGAGVSVWTATDKTPPERVEETRALLQAIGKEVYVPSEKYVDMATGLSGSGPAYVFLFIEALTDAGCTWGCPGTSRPRLRHRPCLAARSCCSRLGDTRRSCATWSRRREAPPRRASCRSRATAFERRSWKRWRLRTTRLCSWVRRTSASDWSHNHHRSTTLCVCHLHPVHPYVVSHLAQ